MRPLVLLLTLLLPQTAWAENDSLAFKVKLLKARVQHEAGVVGGTHNPDCWVCYRAAEEGKNPWEVLHELPIEEAPTEKLRRESR